MEDALEAADTGAAAVGFVFAPSKRQVTPAEVAPISRALPPHVERVGVFGDHTPEEIVQAIEIAELTTVQLHAGFNRAFTQRLRSLLDPEVSIIETIHWTVGANPGDSARTAADSLAAIAAASPGSRVLIDAKIGSATGGTGLSFDWPAAGSVLSSQPGLRIILAGGLRPENVAEAIRTLKPWGVDVASGVEREPGRKDFARLKSFIANARGAV